MCFHLLRCCLPSAATSLQPCPRVMSGVRKEIAVKNFAGKIAVVTGGGSGMGRELALQLGRWGATSRFAMCLLNLWPKPSGFTYLGRVRGTRVFTFVADVSIEDQVLAFADAVARDLDTDHIHLLFNNAGIGGGGSFVDGDRTDWDKTFSVC